MWHPELIPVLDDNRILAAHAETHYIDAALTRQSGPWWRHPETQRFRLLHEVLRSMHYALASEMGYRGYNHKSPMEGPHFFGANLQTAILGTEHLDCFFQPFPWLEQDKADLYRKWMREGRWKWVETNDRLEQLAFSPGAMIHNHPGMFHPPRRPEIIVPSFIEYEVLAKAYPHREWTKADSKRLKEQMTSMGLIPVPP